MQPAPVSVTVNAQLRIEIDGVKVSALPPITNDKSEPKSFKEYLTAEQAAEYINVHVETLRKWVRLGKFPRIPLPGAGKDFRFSKAMIDEWVRKRALI